FHNVIIPGTLFGMLAGVHLWFPKAFGFRLHEGWGRASFWCWAIGFYLAFMPLYALGLMGAMRSSDQWLQPEYLPVLGLALCGALLILAGLVLLLVPVVVSVRQRDRLRVPGGDPWDGRSLEWATPAPVPEYNFAVVPEVHSRDAFTWLKRHGLAYAVPAACHDIEMPKHSAAAPLIGLAS